jgi:thiol-disulfide isomerase/thioredoxin
MNAGMVVACVLSMVGVEPGGGAPPAEPLRVHVVDETGKSVAGAHLGTNGYRAEKDSSGKNWALGFYGEKDVVGAETDAAGEYVVAAEGVFFSGDDSRPKSLIAWNDDHSKVGLALVRRSDLGGRVEVKLEPACRVQVKTRSTSMERLGLPLTWANVYVYWGQTRPFGCDSEQGLHEFWLPPGEYKLNAYSSDTYGVAQTFEVKAGETEKTFEADLPANRLSELVGKPAPELVKIKGWKNGGPVKLADLKGRVVVLDFWGYWCGPCVHSMPELMETYEKYKDKGLVVIAVHDDSTDSIEDMDRKLEQARREIWGGKDLPFLVALDGGGETPIEGKERTARGATTAAYGIDSFPTQVLIDREGKVVGRARKGAILEQLSKGLSGLR